MKFFWKKAGTLIQKLYLKKKKHFFRRISCTNCTCYFLDFFSVPCRHCGPQSVASNQIKLSINRKKKWVEWVHLNKWKCSKQAVNNIWFSRWACESFSGFIQWKNELPWLGRPNEKEQMKLRTKTHDWEFFFATKTVHLWFC